MKKCWPFWVVFLCGGNYSLVEPIRGFGRSGWYPGLARMTMRYFRESWKSAGYSWWGFVSLSRAPILGWKTSHQDPPQQPQTQARGDDFGGGDVQDGGSWS